MSSGSSSADQPSRGIASEDFIRNYYEHLGEDDVGGYSPEELAARATEHYHLARKRARGREGIGVSSRTDSSVVMIVTDDMPFLVDSVTTELVRQQCAIRLVVHPTFVATRDRGTNELQEVKRVPSSAGVSSGDTAALPTIGHLVAGRDASSHIESWIAVEIEGASDQACSDRLIAGLHRVLGDVRLAVQDWAPMRHKARTIAESLSELEGAAEIPDIRQAQQLLRWLDDGNFTFLGFREYDLVTINGEDVLRVREDSGLGLLRSVDPVRQIQHLTRTGQAKAREKQLLVITKANSRSTVHRGSYLDYIGLKNFDAEGRVIGERRFIGLFATSAYTGSVRNVPIVRERVAEVLRRCGFPADSHSGKDLLSILETYPRDELFQIDTQDLVDTAMGILTLQERRRTRLFLRPDIYGRFMSALVYLPRDRYTTSVRLRIEQELRETFDAESIDFEARMSESALARLFFRIRLPRGADVPVVGTAELEQRLVRAARSWSEGISEAAHSTFPRDDAARVKELWAEAFPANYRVDYEVEDALEDVARFEALQRATGPGMHVYVPAGAGVELEEDARLKLYLMEPKSLTQILPFLHNLGIEVLDERPFEIENSRGQQFYLYDLGLKYPAGVDVLATAGLFKDALAAAMMGRSESDLFDRLVLREQLTWSQVVMLRSYAKYMRQMGNANSYGFVADTLLHNAVVTRALVRLFESRFDPEPGARSNVRAEAVDADLAAGLEQVPTLDADRVLRTFVNLIEATLRTNYFQRKPHLSLKFATAKIEGAPVPRPLFEIWVYSPRMEGVHLRFGAIARGGLRWSDRREDFRTEILGLVKAQTVKNAVIVPSGAKGGFFAKQLPDAASDRAGWWSEGQECYRTFIRGMLDITDNLVTTQGREHILPPADVVRHDGDDSYLVVAADKGTASFSDIANELSAEYGFWLGDAFASGGSVGYDHKAMGITARGAWESVKRHFSEFNLDTQHQDFTVAGIGDMSGDVFGNGMLLSEHIRLVAAFDHRHIFLDPSPDAAVAFAERRRLFALPRSSWQDYDSTLISPGGGVYSREAKSVAVSAEVRSLLDLDGEKSSISPPELLRAILMAPVDLLYNGGIGTYIKASDESHAEVGDRTNDAIRVDGRQLRARVVGEGGNLGLTQRGRIEAALNGVLLNTDAIDNSAGVDCSDHEVNIKIFVDRMVTRGQLDPGDRAGLLHSMTEDVARLVLADNVAQNVMLLNDRQRVLDWSPSYERLMDWFETSSGLDRNLEALPTTQQLRDRVATEQGLTSPELSVLASHAKIELTRELTSSGLAEDPYFARVLRDYFPPQLAERFGDLIDTHPLRREIIATTVANDMINIGGVTFAFRVMEETSASAETIARAFVALREIYEVDRTLAAVGALPADFPTEHWCTIHLDLRRLLDRAVRWFVNNVPTTTVDADIEAFKPVVAPLRAHLGDYLRGRDQDRLESWNARADQWGLPLDLARRWSEQFESFALLDIALCTRRIDEPVESIARVYYAVYDRFDVDRLLERITALPREDRWQALARAALREDLYSTVADITVAVMNASPQDTAADAATRLGRWEDLNAAPLTRAQQIFDEVDRLGRDDMASLSVALRLLRSMVR